MTKKTARIEATQAGFRVTIVQGEAEKVIASEIFHFCFGPKNGWGSNAIDKAWDKAKAWAAGFCCA